MSAISIILIFSMLAVIWSDVTRYLIPNWLVGLLLLAYPVALYLSPTAIDWKMALAGAGIVFAVGYFIFVMNWMGGGDIKLLAVLSLWVGWEGLVHYMAMVAMLGGLFALILYFGRKAIPFIPLAIDTAKLPRVMRENEPVPYGVAIAIAFLWVMGKGAIALLPSAQF